MLISDFQSLIRVLYFKKDYERGIRNTFIWLVEEIGELGRLLKKNKLEIKKISDELADIIAWTNSIANLLDIDIEKALLKKYPNQCIKCGKNPCQCEN
ncbi:MAG: MazG nucleotide pyrophosphohydrolase domain-containing protein [Candidatus Hodarchaeota archaeon]